MDSLEQFQYIAPVVALLLGAAIVLSADLITERRAPTQRLSFLVLVVAALTAVWQATSDITGDSAFRGAVIVDEFSLYFTFLLIAITAAVVISASEGLARVEQKGEFYALLLTSTGSMVLLAQAQDLIMIFVALETTSIVQFVLAGIARDDRSSEAGLKYLLTGAISAAVLLYGFAFLFGLAGTTSLAGIAAFVGAGAEETRLAVIFAFVLVAAGLGFKMAIVPFQAWVPDVYQGSPTPVTTFLSVASKAAGFAVVLRVFYTGLGGGDTFISEDWGEDVRRLCGPLDDVREHGRYSADRCETAARLLLDRTGRQHRRRARGRGRREHAGAGGGAVLPRYVRGDEPRRVHRGDHRLGPHRLR